MEGNRATRRLSAILAADVVAYSRLMSEDEGRTLGELQTHRSEVVIPAIARHQGRIVKLMGDGLLAEFSSVVEAIECSAEIQREMTDRNAEISDDRKITFRIGVHLGDIIIDGDDIYGDGVNIAARLEEMAEAGGVCLSRQAYDQVEGKLPLVFRKLGPQILKNLTRPVEAYSIDFGDGSLAGGADTIATRQEISFCRAPDGTRLAYATVGQGPPLVKTANWLNHLEYDWESPIWRHLLHGLARTNTVIRYDARGTGLSDWEVDELSLAAWVGDLEAVVDAVGVRQFPLLGISQGCAISIAYAARHPERVSHLILYGGFAIGGKKRSNSEREKRDALMTLMRLGWGGDNAVFRQLFTSMFIPGGTKEQADWFNELQRKTTSAECAARFFDTVGDFDVTELLAKISMPTLVLHVRGDVLCPIEFGRQMAAGIRGARFVTLPGQNHLFLEHEPASARFLEEVALFLGQVA